MVKIPKAVVNVNPKNRLNLKNKNSSKKAGTGTTPSYPIKQMARDYGTTEAKLKSQLMVK